MGEIIFNGRSSRDIGLEVETFPEYQSPKRTYEKIHIPGRNGDLLIDNGCWENATRTYLVSAGSLEEDYFTMMNRILEWLRSTTTYARLEDSYEPEHYRMAVFLEEFTITNLYNQGGQATIAFDCKPQRFLKLGDDPIVVTKVKPTIHNPTGFLSLPLIEIHGSGTGVIDIGSYHVDITDIGEGVILDCDLQDAYYGMTNKNPVIKIPNGFPKLEVGDTTIGFSGGITKVEVIPRWYTL